MDAIWVFFVLLGTFCLASPTADREIECTERDDVAYCVYKNSLCYSKAMGPIIITTDKAKDGFFVPFQNERPESPLHIPRYVLPNSKSRNDASGVAPRYSFFTGATYFYKGPDGANAACIDSSGDSTSCKEQGAKGVTFPAALGAVDYLKGWSLVAAFDAANYNLYVNSLMSMAVDCFVLLAH